jgi:phage gp36-like protein
MSNWTSITADNLKAAGHGDVIDAARTTETGAVDPVAQAIADAVASVRTAVSAGNSLDVDTTKVPNSLLGLTIRIAFYELCRRIRLPLTEDDRSAERADQSRINRITDKKLRVEVPDNSDGTAEMQRGNLVAGINVPGRKTGRDRCSGL